MLLESERGPGCLRSTGRIGAVAIDNTHIWVYIVHHGMVHEVSLFAACV